MCDILRYFRQEWDNTDAYGISGAQHEYCTYSNGKNLQASSYVGNGSY